MNNSKIYLIISFMMSIFLMITVSFGCADNMIIREDDSDKSVININENVLSFCAKEETKENRIYFKYPQLQEFTENNEEINALIVGFVESTLQNWLDGDFKGDLKGTYDRLDWNTDNYMFNAIDIDYKIMRNDSDYFSIIFEGLCNSKFAAHPTHCFIPITIDKTSKKLITINDLYHINDDFINIFRKEVNKQIREGLAIRLQILPEDIPDDTIECILESFNDVELYAIKENFIQNSGHDYKFFLTNETLGISISIPFVMGDHFEININYDELQQFSAATNSLRY